MYKLKYDYIRVTKHKPFKEPTMAFDLICNKININEQKEDLKKVGFEFINIDDYIKALMNEMEKEE